MTDYQHSLTSVEQLIEMFGLFILDIKPQKRDLKWFSNSQTSIHQHRIQKSTEDLLNHASALIGYFEGYDERGRFQSDASEVIQNNQPTGLLELYDYISIIQTEVHKSIQELLRKPLMLSPNGPKKPGPERTMIICKRHFLSLAEQICFLTLLISNSETHTDTINEYLQSIPTWIQ